MILGLDMSTQKTGWSLWSDNGTLEKYGVWEHLIKDEDNWRVRITLMAQGLRELLAEYGKDIHIVYIEDNPPELKNMQTVKMLSHLQGYMKAVIDTYNIPIDFVSVAEWHNGLGIKVSGTKEYNAYKKQFLNGGNKMRAEKVGRNAKPMLKKMSVEYANHHFGTELEWRSFTSKKNDDDIADAINIVAYKLGYPKYDIRPIKEILQDLCK